MELKWKKAESTEYPNELDTGTSPNTIYVRRNIREVERKAKAGPFFFMSTKRQR